MSLRKVFTFDKWPVTVLTLGCYLAVIIASLVAYERLPSPPGHATQKPDDGLDLTSAWRDLHAIASAPHPFNSRENDIVHDFILQRLLHINNGTAPYMAIDDDRNSNTTAIDIAGPGFLCYLESRNILVKFDGTKDNLPAVLLSAHYDSSALAPGATDNSMAVVTLLQLAQYFVLHQPTRTVILNFNNGEEDGLHGARLFLEHPWSKLVGLFINLEGAGAGGRAALFRTTSPRLTAAFSAAAHPHGSVMFSDLFASGAVRSITDFQIYDAAGMTGIDYAFYTGRHKYHTVYDSIPSLKGKKALWGMMENVHGAAVSVAHDTRPEDDKGSKVIYFDIFAEAWVVLQLHLWLVLNIILVTISPMCVGGMVYLVYKKRKLHWGKRGWGRLPLAFVIGAASCFTLSLWLNTANGETLYRNSYPVLISVACTTVATLLTPLWLADWWKPVANQRTQLFFETYICWWVVALVNVVLMATRQFGGLYFITFAHAGAFLATILSLLDMLRLDALQRFRIRVDETQGHSQHVPDQGPSYDPPRHANRDAATERTPLLPRAEEIIGSRHYGEGDLSVIWILEFLLAVPFPVILLVQMLLAETAALSTTIVDGSSAFMVYILMSITVLLTVLPLAPYAHRLPIFFYIGVLSVGVLSILYCLVSSPFSADAPFKAWFFQTVDLDSGNNTVKLQGLAEPLSQLVKEVPSAINAESDGGVQWSASGIPRFKTAAWAGLAPKISSAPMDEWLSLHISSVGTESARFRVHGVHTKACRLYFDTRGGTAIKRVRVDNGSWVDIDGWGRDAPLESFALWSREWDKTWVVDVEWTQLPTQRALTLQQPTGKRTTSSASSLSGRAACLWADRTAGKIPAIDELYVFMPTWATLSAGRGGLVEGYKAFEV